MAATRIPKFIATCPDCGEARGVWSAEDVARPCVPCSRKKNTNSLSHGMSRHRLYRIYQGMVTRCGHTSSRHIHANRYADRGISVCEEWRESRVAFFEWAMANGYADGLQLDRVDNDGPYSPENCRWTTAAVNAKNRAPKEKGHKLTVDIVRAIKARMDEGNTAAAVAREFGISKVTTSRIRRGETWGHA